MAPSLLLEPFFNTQTAFNRVQKWCQFLPGNLMKVWWQYGSGN
jgi:hypothetical protein